MKPIVKGIIGMLLAFVSFSCSNRAEQPNIVLIINDAMRSDHMSLYGYERETTPNIDKLAFSGSFGSGVISAHPSTPPAMASLFTSLYPSTHEVSFSFRGSGDSCNILSDEVDTIAEVLRDNGYVTGAFAANPFISRDLGFTQGFDYRPAIYKDHLYHKTTAEEVNAAVLNWIKKNTDKKFFAYLHYMDNHGPYHPPAPFNAYFVSDELIPLDQTAIKELGYIRKYAKDKSRTDLNYFIDQYDGGIRYVDKCVGDLIDSLKKLGVYDNTIVVFTSDHGEAFYEHGHFDHGNNLYNEEISVPLIIRLPKPQKLELDRAELVDVGTTLLSLVGLNFRYKTSGRDLSKPDSRVRYVEKVPTEDRPYHLVAMITDDYKFIYRNDVDAISEIYGSEDKKDKVNLADKMPLKAEEAKVKIKKWVSDRRAEGRKLGLRKQQVMFNKDTLRRLRSLGYVND